MPTVRERLPPARALVWRKRMFLLRAPTCPRSASGPEWPGRQHPCKAIGCESVIIDLKTLHRLEYIVIGLHHVCGVHPTHAISSPAFFTHVAPLPLCYPVPGPCW